MPRRAATIALLLWSAAAARADDMPPLAHPALLPEAIRALHGPEGESAVLRVTFDRTRDGAAAAPVEIVIGADYFALPGAQSETIYDLKLRRRLVIDRQAKTLINFSLFGDLVFRHIELARRMEIASTLSGLPGKSERPQSLEPFWIESELGLAWPGAAVPATADQRNDADGAHFLFAGKNVANATASATLIPTELLHSYGAYLHQALPIHPSIAEALALTQRVPETLDYVSEAGGKSEKIALKLREAKLDSGDYPLPASLSLVLLPPLGADPDVATLHKVLPLMVAAVTRQVAPRPIESYRKAIDQALKAKQGFETTLLVAELALQWGRAATSCGSGDDPGPCHDKDEIEKAVSDDGRAMTMFRATASQAKEPEQALASWAGLKRDDVADGYVVDILMARLLSVRGKRAEAANAFIAAFEGNASIPTLYRDLGDHFARVSRTDLAWLCYDLGRALPGRADDDALSAIDALEQELAENYPELF
jgi:hypothetical protein